MSAKKKTKKRRDADVEIVESGTVFRDVASPNETEKALDEALLSDQNRQVLRKRLLELAEELDLDEHFMDAITAIKDSGAVSSSRAFAEIVELMVQSQTVRDWISAAVHFAEAPKTAPELWADRDASSEELPHQFIERVYGSWLNHGALHQGMIHSLDEPLYRSYYRQRRAGQVPGDFRKKLLTKSEFIERQIKHVDELPASKRAAAQSTVRSRRHRNAHVA